MEDEEGKWVYSSSIINDGDVRLLYCDEETSEFWIYVDKDTVCEFSGICDKNDKLIFDGDIVEVTKECVYERGIVELRHGSFFIKVKETLLPLYQCKINNYVIKKIGNIYDNPDLLGE